jgi:Na+/H+-dicarboxylate symporter
VSFVLPAGYSFNMDGTSLYLTMAVGFVAQAAGVKMALSQQILMMLTLMLTSKGVAAVPRAGMVILSGTLVQFGLPLQGVAVILGVDAFMDMARTSLNLVGNCLATVVMARWDGSFDEAPTLAKKLVRVYKPATTLHYSADRITPPIVRAEEGTILHVQRPRAAEWTTRAEAAPARSLPHVEMATLA